MLKRPQRMQYQKQLYGNAVKKSKKKSLRIKF